VVRAFSHQCSASFALWRTCEVTFAVYAALARSFDLQLGREAREREDDSSQSQPQARVAVLGDGAVKRRVIGRARGVEVACYFLPSVGRDRESDKDEYCYFKRRPCLFTAYKHAHPCMVLSWFLFSLFIDFAHFICFCLTLRPLLWCL
jgi:hypothetical protein